jgi:hypothetical protein
MATARLLNLLGLGLGLAGALILVHSADRLLIVLAKASSPTVYTVGRGPDAQAISQLGQDVTASAALWQRRVRLGRLGIVAGVALQAAALFV